MDRCPHDGSESPPRPRKKYKTHLDSDGQHVVSARTLKRQENRRKTGQQHRSKLRRDTSNDAGVSSQLAKQFHSSNKIHQAAGCHGNSSESDQNTTEQGVSKIIPPVHNGSSSNEGRRSEFDHTSEDDNRIATDAEDMDVSKSDDGFIDTEDVSDAESCCSNESINVDYSIYENWVMFEASSVTVWEVFSMVQAMVLRFKLSDEARQSILEFAKILAGSKFKHLNTSKYTMEKVYNVPADKKSYVFYCPPCATVLCNPIQKTNLTGTEIAVCAGCSKKYPLTTLSDDYFLTIDIVYQLRSILENPDIQKAIMENLATSKVQVTDENVISDIHSSSRYRNCSFIDEKSTTKSIVLTLNVNVDGAPLFNTGKSSLWPIQAIINEIPAKLRFKYFILAALWLTKSEPKPSLMSVYLRFFIEQVLKLMKEGVSIKNDEGETITYFIMIFGFPVDTPARALLRNRIQFNGYYGCSWCYIKGGYTGGTMKYPVSFDSEERTHDKYLKDLDTFERERHFLKHPDRLTQRDRTHLSRLSRGCKGASELTSLPSFDCVWGYPFEYLHAILLGVSKQLWEEWINPQSPAYLEPCVRNIVEERLISVQPPNEMHRLPRLLKDRAKWRGSEWRSWLLFYSIPCLIDILREEFLSSYMLFVRAANTLLHTNITEDDLYQCEIDLIKFVGDCEIFYSERFMTFNVHILLHATESVRQNGPLWATSAFPFESQIGNLKCAVTGPKGVVEQISNRVLQANIFKCRISMMSNENETWQFCKSILNYHPLLRNYHRTKEAVLIEVVPDNDLSQLKYKRCIYDDVVYHSMLYTRPKRVNNRVVKLLDGTVLEIEYFTVIDTVCHLVGKKWDTTPFNRGITLNYVHCVNEVVGDSIIVPITTVDRKLACLSMERVQKSISNEKDLLFAGIHDVYVCMLPNTIEVQ